MPDSDSSDSPDQHSGYDPERGLLERTREWVDLFPWLRLGRTLRAAASPIMVGLTTITFAIWWSVHSRWFIPNVDAINEHPVHQYRSVMSLASLLEPLQLPGTLGNLVMAIVWALVCCLPCILFLTRQGALLTAGREMAPLSMAGRRSIRIAPTAWLVAAVPLICALLFALMVAAIGFFVDFVAEVPVLHSVLVLFLVILSLPCGILGFGSLFAIPLGWAALSNERDSDSLDGLSRGYEYLYRRPIKMLLYLFLITGLLLVVVSLAIGIQVFASALVTSFLGFIGANATAHRVAEMLQFYPVVMMLTMFWALVGGVYLLLRHDAGSQEIEDIWQPKPKPTTPLPELKK